MGKAPFPYHKITLTVRLVGIGTRIRQIFRIRMT